MSSPLEILTTHGVVDNASSACFQHRNLLDSGLFRKYLRTAPPFRDLRDAVSLGGRSLTIDDSTMGAFRAALIAREYNQPVTIFLNAENIVDQCEYPLCHLNRVLDAISHPTCFDGLELNDVTIRGKKAFRKKIKAIVATKATNRERLAYVEAFRRSARVPEAPLPDHLRSMTLRDVHTLVDAGVAVENHGWSHHDYGHISPLQARDNAIRAKEWIRQVTGSDPRMFAVPFGDSWPVEGAAVFCDFWFLLLSKERQGHVGNSVVNRRKLSIHNGECM